jgi:hypothetical protein
MGATLTLTLTKSLYTFEVHALVMVDLRGVMANAVSARIQADNGLPNIDAWASSNLALNTRPLNCAQRWAGNLLSDFLALAHRDSCGDLRAGRILRGEKSFAPLGQHSYVLLPFLRPGIEICFGVAIINRVSPFVEQIALFRLQSRLSVKRITSFVSYNKSMLVVSDITGVTRDLDL